MIGKIPQRASVPLDFQAAMKEIANRRLLKIQQEFQFAMGRQKDALKAQRGSTMIRLDKIRTDPAYLDMEVTKLRSLPYSDYCLMNDFLYGLTKDVIIPSGRQKWNMGPYRVYVPVSVFGGPAVGFRFLPDRRPDAPYRHPHHSTTGSTCWGGFSSIIVSLCDEADIPELFRQIYIYLCRYDPHSVLTHSLSTGAYPFARLS